MGPPDPAGWWMETGFIGFHLSSRAKPGGFAQFFQSSERPLRLGSEQGGSEIIGETQGAKLGEAILAI